MEGRRSVMKLGERMVKIFNEMLIMSGKVEFPQQSKCGVRISIRMNKEPGQLPGLVVSAASCLSIPLTPLQVFNCLRSNDTRHQVSLFIYLFILTKKGHYLFPLPACIIIDNIVYTMKDQWSETSNICYYPYWKLRIGMFFPPIVVLSRVLTTNHVCMQTVGRSLSWKRNHWDRSHFHRIKWNKLHQPTPGTYNPWTVS